MIEHQIRMENKFLRLRDLIAAERRHNLELVLRAVFRLVDNAEGGQLEGSLGMSRSLMVVEISGGL
jgi:hypothetical protein